MGAVTLAGLSGARVYLDANVFIYFLDGTPALKEHATRVLSAARDGALRAITGDAAVAEVMAGPYRTGDQMLIRSVREFFAQPRLIEVVSHDARAFDDAAMLRGSLGLPFIDALHIATAAAEGCEAIITHDARMKPALGVDIVLLETVG